MSKIIPLTKEHLKKFNLLGMDVSLGFAKYAFQNDPLDKYKYYYTTNVGWHSQPLNYLFDHTEENEIITHRLILWRFKIEVKSVVEYKTQPEGFRIAQGLVFT